MSAGAESGFRAGRVNKAFGIRTNNGGDGAVRLRVALLLPAATAWVVLAAWADLHPHHGHPALWPALTGWVLMVTAMMLPTTGPLLELLRRLNTGRTRPVVLGGLLYTGVWIAAGVVLISTTALASAWIGGWAWTVDRPYTLPGLALLVAGLYQFTAVKDRCLTACRSPRGVAMTRWTGARPAWRETSAIALAYAGTCVGCCWALMAAGLTAGAGGLTAMAVLTLLMAAERLTRWGRALVRPAGAAAIVLGAALALGVDRAFLP